MPNAPTKEVSKESATVVDLPSGTGPAKNPAGQRRLSEATYEQLVEALRQTEDPSQAAQRVGCDRRTAKKVWLLGMGPAYRFGQRPVCEIVREEKMAARAMLGADAEAPTAEEMEAARKDVARARADEARMLRVAKGNLLGMLAVTSSMVAGAVDLAKRVSKELKNFENPMQAMRLMRDMATMTRAGVEAVDVLMTLERKALGGGFGLGADREVMSVEEAERELREVDSALQRAKTRWGDAGLEARAAADQTLEGGEKKNRIAEALAETKAINAERLRAPGSAAEGDGLVVSGSASEEADDDELEDLR